MSKQPIEEISDKEEDLSFEEIQEESEKTSEEQKLDDFISM